MSENTPEFRIYISSTLDDMEEERKAAQEIIAPYAIAKTSYRASEEGSIATCTEDVRKCHLYVGIIGHRYGWTPEDSNGINPLNKSITELEYDACVMQGQPKINRLIYMRTNSDDRFRDENPKPINSFRTKAGHVSEQQAFTYNDIEAFKLRLQADIIEKHNKFLAEAQKNQAILLPSRKPDDDRLMSGKQWNCKLHPICLITAPGDASIPGEFKKLKQDYKQLFSVEDISPDDPLYLSTLEKFSQSAQLTCIVITPTVLQRFSENKENRDKITRALRTLQNRTQRAVLLLVNIDKSDLIPDWQEAECEYFDVQSFRQDIDLGVDQLFSKLAHTTVNATSTHLALPWLAIAPTKNEIAELTENTNVVLEKFKDKDEREQRREQLKNLIENAKNSTSDWPKSIYGDKREDWHCCEEKTIKELIESVIDDINNSTSRYRERQILRDAQLVSRPYSLNEYFDDVYGSKTTITNLKNKGCIVIVDEIALLHPILRAATEEILASPQVAAIFINPCDPTCLSTAKLLHAFSYLQVASVTTRFRREYDPQCELSSNNEDRIRRWLRHATPRLIMDMDESSGRPLMVDQASKLLA
jgi:hypothetical protein